MDIVERLRAGETWPRMAVHNDAADEIERLRSALRRLMPANWRDDPDWVKAAHDFGLTPTLA